MSKIVKYKNDKWKNKMTVWKCRVFENMSINSVAESWSGFRETKPFQNCWPFYV